MIYFAIFNVKSAYPAYFSIHPYIHTSISFSYWAEILYNRLDEKPPIQMKIRYSSHPTFILLSSKMKDYDRLIKIKWFKDIYAVFLYIRPLGDYYPFDDAIYFGVYESILNDVKWQFRDWHLTFTLFRKCLAFVYICYRNLHFRVFHSQSKNTVTGM